MADSPYEVGCFPNPASLSDAVPRGVVSIGGITDLVAYTSPEGCGSAVVPLMGGGIGEVGERYAQASPVSLVPPVPVHLIVGACDTIVPRAQADAFLGAAGSRATLSVVEGAGHFDLIAPDGDAWAALRHAVRALLTRPAEAEASASMDRAD